MGFADLLSKVFGNLTSLIKVENHFHFNFGDTVSGDKIQRDEKTNTFNIDLSKISPSENNEIGELFKKEIDDKKIILIGKESEKLLTDFQSNQPNAEETNLLISLKEHISADDYLAIRASLFMNSQYKQGKTVFPLKNGIRNRFGERGCHISNLLTSGYFENLILPLLEYFKNGSKIEEFKPIYEKIIKESAFAVFVNRSMNEEEVKSAVINQLEKNRKYGFNYLNIHGIGKKNIKKIKDTVDNLLKDPVIEKEKEESIADKFIFVRLKLKPESPQISD